MPAQVALSKWYEVKSRPPIHFPIGMVINLNLYQP